MTTRRPIGVSKEGGGVCLTESPPCPLLVAWESSGEADMGSETRGHGEGAGQVVELGISSLHSKGCL
jgi:hypothetical protein